MLQVVITTSVGEIDIELWPKEAPKVGGPSLPHAPASIWNFCASLTLSLNSQAVRNFVQLCLESYYDKTIFHRRVCFRSPIEVMSVCNPRWRCVRSNLWKNAVTYERNSCTRAPHRIIKDFMVQGGDPTGTGTGERGRTSGRTSNVLRRSCSQPHFCLTFTRPAAYRIAGGDSIYGEPFVDEIHSRIHFNHRGQVAMANAGNKDSNGSQARGALLLFLS